MDTETEFPESVIAGPCFTIPLVTLFDALAAFAPVSLKCPVVPVLGGLLITSNVDGITLRAFDYETSVSVALDVGASDEPAQVLVTFAELAKVLKAATKGETRSAWSSWNVEFRSETHSGTELVSKHIYDAGVRKIEKVETPWTRTEAVVAVGGFELPLSTLPIDGYPKLPVPQAVSLTADRDELAGMLSRVSVASGKDATLPEITGTCWELTGARLTLVATDRFRLAVGRMLVQALDEPVEGNWLVSTEGLMKLLKALPSGPLTVGLPPGSDPWVTVRAGNITATVAMVYKEFLKWRGVVPKKFQTHITVDRAQLVKLLTKAEALNSALDHGHRQLVRLIVAEGQVSVTPRRFEDTGRVQGVALPCDITGGGVTIDFRPKLLLDALGTFTSARVAIGFGDSNQVIVIADKVAELSSSAASFRHLVMPNRLLD